MGSVQTNRRQFTQSAIGYHYFLQLPLKAILPSEFTVSKTSVFKTPDGQSRRPVHSRSAYATLSTADQNPDLQEDALQKAGCEKIFRDVASGAVDSRRGLAEAIDYARDGDTLVVWKLDRLGRSLKHLIETVNGLCGMATPEFDP